ncbi:MAG: CD1107 family mobile element protein [Brevinema sp.]
MKLTKWIITTLMATTLMLSSSVVVFAGGGDETETVTTEEVTIPVVEEKNEDVSFSPDGNLSMVDDVIVTDETHKQFIIAQSKNGNYFYVVIDRTKDSENVYLLNMVDEADLVALANGETVPLEPTAPPEEVEPVPPEENTDTEPEEEEKPENNMALIVILVLGLGGLGGAYYFFFVKGKNVKPDVPTNIGFDEDDEEDERYTTEDAFGSETENEDDDNDTEVV